MPTIVEICQSIQATTAALKSQGDELLGQFEALDGAVRRLSQDPFVNGELGNRRPTECVRADLATYLLDELHALLRLQVPRREVYYVEGRKVVNGPAEGTLEARILGRVATVEARIEKMNARAKKAPQSEAT